MVFEPVGSAPAGGHEEVLAAAGEVDASLLVAGANSEVELGVEAELAGVDAVVGDEGLVLGQSGCGVGKGRWTGLD